MDWVIATHHFVSSMGDVQSQTVLGMEVKYVEWSQW
jgi:hypothetical protein